MQAIETKYYGPTNHRGSRVRAKAQVGTLWHDWDYSLSADENHTAAARALADAWGWAGEWNGGSNADGTGYVFVNVDRSWSRFHVAE